MNLDNLPLGSLIALASIVGALYALISGSIDFDTFSTSLGALLGGSGVLGLARAASGKGVK